MQWLHAISMSNSSPCPFERNKGIGCGSFYYEHTQPRFVYQFAFLDYYEQVEDWEVEENTNINVVEGTKENYLQSYEYAKP